MIHRIPAIPLAAMRRITPQLAIARSILWLLLIACATTARPPAQAQEAAAEVADSEAAGNESANNESVEIAVPLLERPPFDRLTLNGANQNAVIETVIIDFPNRQVPDPFPASGSLDIRRLSHPSIPYQVQWSAIAKVELFEQMLLAEGERLTAEGKFSEAFAYFAFLTSNYPQLPGLEAALQSHLWREASAAYAAGKREEAWPVLVALYQRNPEYPRLVNAVQAVSDDLIGERMKAKDYASARVLVDSLARSFPQLGLTNIARWQNQFQQDAETQLSRARQALAAKDYGEARDAIAYARNIMPTVPGGIELWREIQATAPEIRVGVTAPASAGVMSQTPTWATARVSDLVNPRMVEMVDFGAEGGVYESRWSSVKSSDDGLRTAITLAPEALTRGLRPATLALRLVEMADVAHDSGAIDFATLAAGVNLAQGRDVEIRWRRPHIRPEAFLQIPLRWLASVGEAPGLWFEPLPPARDGAERSYERTGPSDAAPAGEPRLVVEMQFSDDDAALEALIRGDVDAVDRVPPWQLSRLKNAASVTFGPYRLPTVHVLIPNRDNPLLETREFRRALNYGIDAEGIVRDILLGGEERPGFRTLSGPFPAGVALNDPAGYAYNPALPSRPYEPRLGALLASVARKTLQKREEEKQKAAAAQNEAAAGASPPATAETAEAAKEPAADDATADGGAPADAEKEKPKPPPPKPLILAHSADPLAKLACQSIKIQLDQIGIPIQLAEFAEGAPPPDLQYDLLYAELTVWEPVYDARRLLGSTGVAGRASAMMAAALDQLDRAENWNQAREQLREIHRIAHYDLPLIPLWQTVNYFAHRKTLSGVGVAPVTLYQNLPDWRKSIE